MRILSVDIENILSIEKAFLSFDEQGLCLIEGWNHDTDRANGAGKSAIFNCISFALYDKVPRKITATEILKRNTKKGQVTVRLQSATDDWTIVRKRPKDVKFYKNNIEQTITQCEFESLIGLNYDQFIVTVYNAQSTADGSIRFLSCSDSDKKTFLLKLLNLEKFDLFKKNADSQVKDLLLKVSDDAQKLSNLNSKIEAYSEFILDENELLPNIEKTSKKILELNEVLLSLTKVEKPDIDKFLKLEEDIKNKILNLNKIKYQRELSYCEYEKVLNTTIVDSCPSCGSSIEEIEISKHQAEKEEKLRQLKSKIDIFDVNLQKETELQDLLLKIKEKKNKSTAEYNSAREQSLEIKSLIATQTNELNNLNLKLNKNSSYINKVKELNETGAKLNSQIEENKREIEFYKTISNIYSSTGAQAYVLDSIIDYFNESVQKHIQILWPNVTYTLNSYKENVKGETVARFSETLIMDGLPVSIGSLSGGEAKAISLCIDFALLDVINNQFGIHINPIILDEPFDGLDSSGKEIVIGLLDALSKDRQILVVDHATESKMLFSKIIRVEKRNGTSIVSTET